MLQGIKDSLRYLTTTKITISELNDIVKLTEQALQEGTGEVIVTVRKGKIYSIGMGFRHFPNGNGDGLDSEKAT